MTEFNDDVIMQQVISDMHPTQNTTKDIIKLKEQGVIDALKKLGWTPPNKRRVNFDELIRLILISNKERKAFFNSNSTVSFEVSWRDAEIFIDQVDAQS